MKLSFTFQTIGTYTKEEAIMNTYQWLKNMHARNVRIVETVVKCNASESVTDKIYNTINVHGEFRGVLSMIENGEETWHAPCHIEDDMEFTWENEPVEVAETDVDTLLAACIPSLLEDWDTTDVHNTLNEHGYPVTRRLTDTHITLYFWHNQKIVKRMEFQR